MIRSGRSGQSRPGGWQGDFLGRHGLPLRYLDSAVRWFDPLVQHLQCDAAGAGRPLLVGVNGCQGSGKSTLCDYLASRLHALHGCNAVVLSLDDFYLTREERRQLAEAVHPLLATRGVPGTHDMPLLRRTLDALQGAGAADSVDIPRFDKASDDRIPSSRRDRVVGPVDIVLLEGWCLGARPQSSLQPPVNRLESEEDADGAWRRYVNDALGRHFLPLYPRIDRWVMLRAPDFACVYRWRREQERRLAETLPAGAPGSRVMSDAELRRFVDHYERLTRHCLEHLPGLVDLLFQLDGERRVVEWVGGPCS